MLRHAPNAILLAISPKTRNAMMTMCALDAVIRGGRPTNQIQRILKEILLAGSYLSLIWWGLKRCACSAISTRCCGVRNVLAASVSYKERAGVNLWSAPCANISSAGIVKMPSTPNTTTIKRIVPCAWFCSTRSSRWSVLPFLLKYTNLLRWSISSDRQSCRLCAQLPFTFFTVRSWSDFP